VESALAIEVGDGIGPPACSITPHSVQYYILADIIYMDGALVTWPVHSGLWTFVPDPSTRNTASPRSEPIASEPTAGSTQPQEAPADTVLSRIGFVPHYSSSFCPMLQCTILFVLYQNGKTTQVTYLSPYYFGHGIIEYWGVMRRASKCPWYCRVVVSC